MAVNSCFTPSESADPHACQRTLANVPLLLPLLFIARAYVRSPASIASRIEESRLWRSIKTAIKISHVIESEVFRTTARITFGDSPIEHKDRRLPTCTFAGRYTEVCTYVALCCSNCSENLFLYSFVLSSLLLFFFRLQSHLQCVRATLTFEPMLAYPYARMEMAEPVITQAPF